ncbi:MAG TPA: SHOCT domain-containing protein [Clostridia bacterium]|nr:SHOCT domain-containing protein [Clostridia bacterium]
MKGCYGWRNLFNPANMHGRRWFAGMMPMHSWGGGLFMFLFWALIIAGVVYLIIRLSRNSSPSRYMPVGGQDNAINILRERLARGEISQDEYDERLKILKEQP